MKSIFLLAGLVAILTQAPPVDARWLEPQEAGSVIEKFHIDYEVYKNGSWSQTFEYAIRVQSEDAKVNSSLFPIEYNAFTDQVEVLEAYTLNGKQRIKVEPSAIEDRDKGESKDYDVQKVRSVVFPQVQIGSRLFIRYRVRTTKPLIEDRWSTEVSLAPGYHVESFALNIKSERPLNYSVQDPRGWVQVKQSTPQTISVRNRRPIPGWVHAEKDPVFHPAGQTEIFVSTHTKWPEFFGTLAKDYESILAQDLPKALVPWTEQASKRASASEKIEFLMDKVSRDFRYFGDWRRHNGGFVPRNLQEISDSRYGDCKDLSALLTAMLRKLGLSAQVALVRRGGNPWGEEPDYQLPGVNYFNHAIVFVRDGDKTYWLDPTNPVMSLEPYPDISGRPAYLLNASGGERARLPAAKASDFEHVHDYEYRFKGAEKVSVRVQAQMNRLAGHRLANDLLLSPRSDVLSETLDYFSEGQEVRAHKFLREPQTGRTLGPMHVSLEYDAGRVTFTAGKASFWVIPDGFLQGAFYETEDRESDLQLSEEPYIFKGVRRLKDTKLAQDPPPPCQIDSPWMKLDRTVGVEGADVLISQSVELKKPFITRSEFRSGPFKKLQADTKRCFYRSGILIETQK